MPEGLSTREAAPLFGVSETTLRRAMKAATEAQPHATIVEGECRGLAFHAWRDGRMPRRPWRIVIADHATPQGFTLSPFEIKSADNRIRDLRSAIRTNFEAHANEPEIDFTGATPKPSGQRRWRWKFWSRGK